MVIAAEQYASRLVLPASQRGPRSPWSSRKDIAAKALKKLAGPHLPASLSALERAVKRAHAAYEEAEQAQRREPQRERRGRHRAHVAGRGDGRRRRERRRQPGRVRTPERGPTPPQGSHAARAAPAGIGPAPRGTPNQGEILMSKTRRVLSDEERAERRRADRAFAAQAVEQLRSSEGWQQWLAARRHFHAYSLANQLLIAMQKPEATRVAGFRAWLKLGYCVRKGESALRIWCPCPPTAKQLKQWQDAGADPKQRPRTRFRLGPVFDRSQVSELPPPAEPLPLDPPIHEIDGDDLAWALEPLTQLARELGCTVAYEAMPAGRGGYYRPADKAIRLAEGKAANHSVHTLIHELAHALLAAQTDDDVRLDYAQEELVVESITYTVAGALGLQVDGFAIPYLASWSEGTDLAVIERAAGLIDRLAKRIEDAVQPATERTDSGRLGLRAVGAQQQRDRVG